MATESADVTDTIPSSEATAPRQRPTEDVGEVSDELWTELNELAFTMTDDEAERIYRRRDVTSVLEPKCDRCLVYQGMCTDALKSVHRLSAMVTELEELRPQCEVLKKQVAESQIQIEESLQAEHVLKTRAETAEAEAAQAKEKFDALEKDFDVMAKAAEEGKKHAHEANAWRVKYERTSELSIKIQQKRKADMENFDKVFNLASGYYKEVKHLTASRSAIRKEFNKLSKLVKTYVPVMFSVIKSAMSLPMFKTDLPSNIQQDAEKLCTGDVERAFELDYPDHCSDTDEDDDDGMSSELERLVGCVKLTKKPVESKLPRKPSLTVTVPRKGEKMPVQPVEEQSSNVVDIPATAAVPESEPLPSVTEPDPSELVESSVEQLGDEEADALLELGAEAITMPVPRLSTRGGTRGRGRRGRGARQTPASATQLQALEVFAVNKSYEEILASKLKRQIDVPETTASTSTMKHMSIHGKKTMSVREQQEAQMKISVKEKVALMKKKEEAERVRTLDDDIEVDDACSPAADEAGDTVAPASKTAESESPKKSTVEDFSIARNDLLLSASPSPASSVVEGEECAAEREELSAQVLSLDEGKCDETVVQTGDDEVGMDTDGGADAETRDPADARKSSAAQEGKPTLVDVAKDLIIDCDIPINFIDQILDSEGTEKPPEGTPSLYEESKSRVTTQIEIDIDLGLAESSETAHTEEFLDGEERVPELNVDMNSAESSVPIVAQPPIEGGDTARNEELTLTVQENEAVTEKKGPYIIAEKEVDDAAQKDMDLSESPAAPVANQIAPISSTAETETRGVECEKEESVISKPALAGDTRRAIGFAKRLLVDLEEKLTPIYGGEDGEQMMLISSSEKVVAEQLVESKTGPEGASSPPEKNRSPVEEEADASSCTMEKVIDATPERILEVSEDLSNKSPSKRQHPVRRLSAKDRDLAMQLHAQLNPRSLRSRRESESDSQNLQSASVEHDTAMKQGRRKMRTLSDSQRNDAEVTGSLEMDLKKNLSESKDLGETSAPLGFAIVAESKTNTERDTEARNEETTKKIRADDVSHDVLASARDNSTQEGDVFKKLPTPAKVSEITTDLFDEILAGARSNTTSQRKIAKRKKVPAPKKVHTSGDHASKSKPTDGEISVGPSVSQENSASADTSSVVERESTEEAPIRSEPAPNIEVH
uniref:Reverse transcriptase domain-containing protein n=1 Tax=Haemonchus contortus TaxID=6289 RepID=A0A7I4YI61_HAECO